jgi:hypothetical protein
LLIIGLVIDATSAQCTTLFPVCDAQRRGSGTTGIDIITRLVIDTEGTLVTKAIDRSSAMRATISSRATTVGTRFIVVLALETGRASITDGIHGITARINVTTEVHSTHQALIAIVSSRGPANRMIFGAARVLRVWKSIIVAADLALVSKIDSCRNAKLAFVGTSTVFEATRLVILTQEALVSSLIRESITEGCKG